VSAVAIESYTYYECKLVESIIERYSGEVHLVSGGRIFNIKLCHGNSRGLLWFMIRSFLDLTLGGHTLVTGSRQALAVISLAICF
jgi:hypothetical protein